MASFKEDPKDKTNAEFIARIEERHRLIKVECLAKKEALAKSGDPGSRDLTDSELKLLHEIYKKAIGRFRGNATPKNGKAFTEKILLRKLVSAIEELGTNGPELEARQMEILTLSEALRDSSDISAEAREYTGMIAKLLTPPIPADYQWHFIFRLAARIELFLL